MWPTLKSRRQFDRVYSQGQKRTSRVLVLFHLENAPERSVAFVASRKVGGAVRRNRAKRLMREAFRMVASSQTMPNGWLVLIARAALVNSKSTEVAEHLRTLLAEMHGPSGAPPPS